MLGPLLFNLHVNDLGNQIIKNAHIQYVDDCLLYCTDSESEIVLNRLQENLVKLENYFSFNRLNLNDSKTECITFSRKTDKRLQNSETVVVGSSGIEKSNQCKYIGVTIVKHLDFETDTKKMLKMAVGIKTIETIQHKFPTTVLMLFQALVLGHCEYSAALIPAANHLNVITIVRETDELGLKFVYFRSSIKDSFDLRLHKSVLGFRQRIELKSLTFFQYINNRKKAFVDRIKLPTVNLRLNNCSNQIILMGKVPSVSSVSKSFFHHIS